MKLKVEAFSPLDGIAIVRSGQNLRLIRPPYELNDTPILSEDCVNDALLNHGFSTLGQHFPGWQQLIEFLNDQVIASRRSLGKQIPACIPTKEILDVAPAEVLHNFLDRVERELIPQRSFDHAEDFLLLLLSREPTHGPEICARAAHLLMQNKEARKKVEAGISEITKRDVRFTTLEQHPSVFAWSVRLSNIIRERGCIFVPTS